MNTASSSSSPAAAPGAGKAPAAADPAEALTLENFLEDVRARPRVYVSRFIAFAVIATVVLVALQLWQKSRSANLGDITTDLQKVLNEKMAENERIATLQALEARTKGTEFEPQRLYSLALAYKAQAAKAEKSADKVAAYELMAAACGTIESSHAKWLLNTLPMKPPVVAGGPSDPSPVKTLHQFADEQITWLKAHPFNGPTEPNSNLKVTFTLNDGKKIVISKFREKEAPYHVANMIALARSGYYEGTQFYGFVKAQGKRDRANAQAPQTMFNAGMESCDVMSRLAPWSDPDVASELSEIGYSVREEQTGVAIARGVVANQFDYKAGGDSPSRLVIFTESAENRRDTPFAEVVEGLDVVEAMTKLDPRPTRTDRPDVRPTIKTVTVEGSMGAPLPSDVKWPPARVEPKAPESKPTSMPASQPESGPASKPK